MTDPIADMITRINNACAVGKERVIMPYSKMKHAIADTLVSSGFIASVEKFGKEKKKELDVALAYKKGKEKNNKEKKGFRFSRLSKPGRRMYLKAADIVSHERGGIVILSTPKGILTGRGAREQKVGGEALFEVR
jgi:small subunit ribosomal protein S8